MINFRVGKLISICEDIFLIMTELLRFNRSLLDESIHLHSLSLSEEQVKEEESYLDHRQSSSRHSLSNLMVIVASQLY